MLAIPSSTPGGIQTDAESPEISHGTAHSDADSGADSGADTHQILARLLALPPEQRAKLLGELDAPPREGEGATG